MNTINPIDINQIQSMMQKLKTMAAQTDPASSSVSAAEASGEQPATRVDFGDMLKASLDKVNETQQTAAQLGERFAKGDDSVSLSETMIAGQKANIALQATIQVRTKLVAAYNDIMNMQI